MRPSQRPTCTGLRVRSTRDANVLFHAVTCNILPMVSRRLDAADRAALRPGCVYVWEERSPAADATGAGMERFTEGRHWHPSRVREDFLLYVEKDWETNEAQAAERNRLLRRHRESFASTSYPIQPERRQPLIKQTYSAWVNNGTSLKKWHMNAYYTEEALEELRTVDDIPVLANLNVPHECYQRARSSTASSTKSRDRTSRESLTFPGDVPRMQMPRRNSSTSQSSQSDREQRDVLQGLSHFLAHPRYTAFPPVSAIAPFSYSSPPPQHTFARRLSQSQSSPISSAEGDSSPGLSPPFLVPSQGLPGTNHQRNSAHHFPPPSPSPSATSSHLSSLPSPALDYAAPMPTISAATDVSAGRAISPAQRSGCELVPLERLRLHAAIHREPADDAILRSFRPL